jgi:hypothetical protein
VEIGYWLATGFLSLSLSLSLPSRLLPVSLLFSFSFFLFLFPLASFPFLFYFLSLSLSFSLSLAYLDPHTRHHLLHPPIDFFGFFVPHPSCFFTLSLVYPQKILNRRNQRHPRRSSDTHGRPSSTSQRNRHPRAKITI